MIRIGTRILWCWGLLRVWVPDQALAQPWNVGVEVGLSERYDDNIRLVEEPGEESDRVTTLAPRLSVTYEDGADLWAAGYGMTAEWFATNPELDSIGHDAFVKAELGRLFGSRTTSLTFTDDFTFTPQLTDPASGVGAPRSDSWINAVLLTVSHQSSARTTERIGYANTISRYELPTLIDHVVHEGTAGVTRVASRRDTLGARYRFRYFDVLIEGVESAVDHTVTVEWTRQLSPSLTLTIEAGAERSRQSRNQSTEPVGTVRLAKRLKTLSIDAELSRDIALAGGLSDQLSAAHTASLGASYEVTAKLHADARARMTDNRSVVGGEVDVTSWTAEAGLSYAIRTWLSADIRYYRFEQLAQGAAGEDLVQNRYVVTLAWTLPDE
ncbi:MAG: hypothetical protein AB1515_01440 [Nitrospirota bacterium]